MYAMQYEISLPADYDMSRIRDRVFTRGRATDDLPGLAVKAYLIRDRADGSPRNQYAPFYVWSDVDAMARFLWGGGGFTGIVRDFGRPTVRHWTVAAHLAGPAHGDLPTWAVRSLRPLAGPPPDGLQPISADPISADPDGAVPDEVVPAAVAALARHVTSHTHTQVLAVDPATWEVCEFTLLTERPAVFNGARYEVLHLSRPGRP
jgi:hypothetical protein